MKPLARQIRRPIRADALLFFHLDLGAMHGRLRVGRQANDNKRIHLVRIRADVRR